MGFETIKRHKKNYNFLLENLLTNKEKCAIINSYQNSMNWVMKMHLTLEQDYSIRVSYELCKAQDFMDVGQIADRTGISRAYAQKLTAMGEELYVNSCLTGKYKCTRPEVVKNEGKCEIQKLMKFLNNEWVAHLKSMTFDMVIKTIN